MKYKLTLLKDLPDYPAGTVFDYWNDLRGFCEPRRVEYMGTESYEDGRLIDCHHLLIPREIIDSTVWIKKEVNYEKLEDLKCPTCGETRGCIAIESWRDDREHIRTVHFEYACGHGIRKFQLDEMNW